MDEALGHEITQLLQAWRQGDQQALEKLTPQVYRELHLAAKRCMARERDGHTLQTTALINELYLRLFDLKLIDWQNRAHFFALCARQMRRILTDEARARQSHKRGGGVEPLLFDEALMVAPETSTDLVAVDDALNRLAKVDERKSQVVEMRFFWWPERGRNCRSIESFTRHCDAGLEISQGLAAARTERREARWSVSVGSKSNKSFTLPCKRKRAAEASSSGSRVLEMRSSAARWNRCWPITVKPGASLRRRHSRPKPALQAFARYLPLPTRGLT